MRKVIYTIGRQYGSGGRQIGKLLAEKMGIPCYDKEILVRAAKDSPYTEEIMSTFDEKPIRSLLYSIAMGTTSVVGNQAMPISVQAYLAQYQTIVKLAEEAENGCVFIGRCADYALRDRTDVIRVFIHAEPQFRIMRIMDYEDLSSEKQAEEIMRRGDKDRANYYSYYTEQKWSEAFNYDLCIDSSKIGVEGCVKQIETYKDSLYS